MPKRPRWVGSLPPRGSPPAAVLPKADTDPGRETHKKKGGHGRLGVNQGRLALERIRYQGTDTDDTDRPPGHFVQGVVTNFFHGYILIGCSKADARELFRT